MSVSDPLDRYLANMAESMGLTEAFIEEAAHRALTTGAFVVVDEDGVRFVEALSD